MSVPTLLCLLVLFSTHGWAPQDKHSSVSYSCTSEERALPCKDSYPSSWTVALDLPSETRPHSLVSIISGHPPGTLLWFDPVSVVTTVISGAGVLFLLGVTAWDDCHFCLDRVQCRCLKDQPSHYLCQDKYQEIQNNLR